MSRIVIDKKGIPLLLLPTNFAIAADYPFAWQNKKGWWKSFFLFPVTCLLWEFSYIFIYTCTYIGRSRISCNKEEVQWLLKSLISCKEMSSALSHTVDFMIKYLWDFWRRSYWVTYCTWVVLAHFCRPLFSSFLSKKERLPIRRRVSTHNHNNRWFNSPLKQKKKKKKKDAQSSYSSTCFCAQAGAKGAGLGRERKRSWAWIRRFQFNSARAVRKLLIS